MRKKLQSLRGTLIFRHWSRKPHAIFASLRQTIKIAALIAGYGMLKITVPVYGQKDTITDSKNIDLQEIKIIGQRTPGVYAQVARSITVVDSFSINHSAATDLPQLLQHQTLLDIDQRGINNAQVDVSMRGGTFDQTAILLNGINITDPQTGHLNFTLPVALDDLSRIEVLHGSGSRIYGLNAFKGAINFIIDPTPNTFRTKITVGDFGLWEYFISGAYDWKNTSHYVSYTSSKSDGYISNTDYSGRNFLYSGTLALSSNAKWRLTLGHQDKAFGANSFYSISFPDQYEENQATIAQLQHQYSKEKLTIHTSIFWRSHKDEFQLFRTGENWYRNIGDSLFVSNNKENTRFDTFDIQAWAMPNYHITNITGFSGNVSMDLFQGLKLSLGAEIRNDAILSTDLGQPIVTKVNIPGKDTVYTNQFSRTQANLYGEVYYQAGPFQATAGALLNWSTDYIHSMNVFPGVDLSYRLFPGLKIFGSYNYSGGLPTFTDLFYAGPSNQGNLNLKPYSEHSVDLGFKGMFEATSLTINAFLSDGKDIIQWAYNSATGRFTPNNSNSSTFGLESTANINLSGLNSGFPVEKINLLYRYTFKDNHHALNKYSYYREKAAINLYSREYFGFRISSNLQYHIKEGQRLTGFVPDGETTRPEFEDYPDALLLDVQLTYKIGIFELFGQASNLLDKEYFGAGGLPLPGRWFKAGAQITLSE